ncbi:hydrogenase 1 maturation protease [Plesiomonas shigelloides]|uniref:hydrogenase 1 maturation protease n=1 Tax=Plesiomonas shigelloides TaxID=703 RepID=UPI0012629D4C|nr:hydrogenase 1 maturation protease [Plesiomonas shigelloides]KAB7698985.1 hydrogenase 1 maturation protease [Plesiomonas shigelloides]KAB7700466.1 hydrogenase 1 maturation protease [Plesiomonas shigelloides]KAB7705150.1 hydrogenase 1 maturation protease [Plesiomonas shigelloides]MBW3792774.1 hydrogenase 1 maturation protease [Plesiomonas shigelloides]MCX2496775.1 hydrogenase 1 maturation protease [Plesiomonas shigelloides]
MTTQQQVVIMGLGNILWADEGFGVRAAEKIYAEYDLPDYVEVVDGGTQGYNLLQYVARATHLIILDAIDFGHEPASLHTYEGRAIPAYLSAKKMSLHQSSFSEVLALAEIKDTYPEHVVLIGVQPVLLDDYGGSLTEPVKAQLEPAVQQALGWLARWQVPVKPASTQRRLNDASLAMEKYEGERPRQYSLPPYQAPQAEPQTALNEERKHALL